METTNIFGKNVQYSVDNNFLWYKNPCYDTTNEEGIVGYGDDLGWGPVEANVNPDRLTTYQRCLWNVKKYPYCILYTRQKWITPELCMAHIINHKTLQYIPKYFITKEICDIAVTGYIGLQYVPEKFITKELILKTVSNQKCDIHQILRLSENILIDYEMCLEIVKINPLLCIPNKFQTKELCDLAFITNNNSFGWISGEFMTEEMCLLAIKYNKELFKYIPKSMITLEMCEFVADCINPDFIPKNFVTRDVILKWYKL